MNQAVAKFEPFWAFQKQRSENCVCLGVSDGCTTHSRASGIQVSFKLTGVQVQVGKIGVRQVGGTVLVYIEDARIFPLHSFLLAKKGSHTFRASFLYCFPE